MKELLSNFNLLSYLVYIWQIHLIVIREILNTLTQRLCDKVDKLVELILCDELRGKICDVAGE